MQKPKQKKPNPQLQHWLDVYDDIYADYLGQLEGAGIVFAAPGSSEKAARELRARLEGLGASVRNGGASIAAGWLSSACVACTGGMSETFFISLACTRDCYFCFNPNQNNYEHYLHEKRDWRPELDALAAQGAAMTHIGLTGGEPLLIKEDAYAFFTHARALFPEAHLRLYTAGDLLDEDTAKRLRGCGVDEVRFSLKPDDGLDVLQHVLENIRGAVRLIPDVMVEMPVIPGTEDFMRGLLASLEEAGVRGVNLLEFCFPFNNWDAFNERGFAIKNPPFPVLYNYSYAGSLPVAGSEEAALGLMLSALEDGLALGLHYCSLENKHRDQILQQNRSAAFDGLHYELDQEDFFYKAVKFYGEEASLVRAWLEENTPEGPECYGFDEEDGSLSVHPRLLELLRNLPVTPALSYAVAELREGAPVLRELRLALV
ncbi:MAG: radical SAM protein [Eggerthellaceae bacterium]|nr:radical SAM protein [Eggerthellaceae bacterium]